MIAILLCTYNGSKYLPQQLNSLLNQTFQDFVIYIHDDGSTDDTNIILKKYQSLYKNKIVILEDNIKRRGAKDSFLWLLNAISAKYYMFCDQDDIWLENKIEDTYNKMLVVEKVNPHKPIVIHTDLTLVNQDLDIIHPSYWEYAKINVDISKKFKYLCLGNVVTGCTMLFNEQAKLISMSNKNEYVTMHDYLIALMASQYGILENLKKQTILYRQHEHNVFGCGKVAERKKIVSINKILQWYNWYKNNKSFLESMGYKSFLKVMINKIELFIMSNYIPTNKINKPNL